MNPITVQSACLFITYLYWFLTLIPMRIAQSKQTEGLDNNNPRSQYERLPDWGKRAVAANQNTFEALVFFGSSILVNVINGSGNATATAVFCIIFVIARAVYPFLYYYNKASLRSSVWFLGMICTLGLFINGLAAST